jgi:hypothetical protein
VFDTDRGDNDVSTELHKTMGYDRWLQSTELHKTMGYDRWLQSTELHKTMGYDRWLSQQSGSKLWAMTDGSSQISYEGKTILVEPYKEGQ